jgi:uncharacterized protein
VLLYLDASILVAIVRNEPTQPALTHLLNPGTSVSCVSDLAIAEASAAIAAKGRAINRSAVLMTGDFTRLDEWASGFAETVDIFPDDIAMANLFVRNPDIVLRAPDAIHVAAARRLGITLLTLDRGMARAAKALDVPYLNPADSPADRKT